MGRICKRGGGDVARTEGRLGCACATTGGAWAAERTVVGLSAKAAVEQRPSSNATTETTERAMSRKLREEGDMQRALSKLIYLLDRKSEWSLSLN